MPARVEVELDIFSGMPNPTWVLTDAEADSFVRAVGRGAARPGYGTVGQSGISRVHRPGNARNRDALDSHSSRTIQISKGATKLYAKDVNRELERWLLNTGKPHLKSEIFQLVEREIR